MRLITQQAKWHFENDLEFRKGNTQVKEGKVYLHGHLIIEKKVDGIWATLSGWPTITTQERLNGILNRWVRFQTIKKRPYVFFHETQTFEAIDPNQLIHITPYVR